jgi:general secretion pathway protein G
MVAARRTGFTLIELLIVLAIVALMLSLAMPRYLPRIDAAKEAVLAENLRAVRDTLAHFHGDTGRYPESLQELVDKKYLAALPIDPVTERSDTWLVKAPDDGALGAVFDIHSGAPGTDREGRPYAQW